MQIKNPPITQRQALQREGKIQSAYTVPKRSRIHLARSSKVLSRLFINDSYNPGIRLNYAESSQLRKHSSATPVGLTHRSTNYAGMLLAIGSFYGTPFFLIKHRTSFSTTFSDEISNKEPTVDTGKSSIIQGNIPPNRCSVKHN